MIRFLETAGECLSIDCGLVWVDELIAEGSAGGLAELASREPSVRVRVDASRQPFALQGWELLTRDAWRRGDEVVVENACTAGFDLHLRCARDCAEFTYRWRPPTRDRVAARILRSRFHLLARAVLTQYPVLWWAGTRGRVPLHASACAAGSSIALVAAAGGIGRSSLLLREVASGGSATGDNLSVGDGTTVWGLVEPLRIKDGDGRRMPHGRREMPLPRRVDALMPDRLVVMRRGAALESSLVSCAPEVGANLLTAATYMAGELRRYWAFAATLAAGTGVGPPHPAVQAVASEFAGRLPGFSLILGRSPGARLSELVPTLVAA